MADPLAELMSMSSVAGLTSGEVQTEHTHKVNIKKLKLICDMILTGYNSIEAIYIIPGSLFSKNIEDVDNIIFETVVSSNGSDWYEEGESILKYYMEDEYPEFKGTVSVITLSGPVDYSYGSYILMSSKRHQFSYEQMCLTDMKIIYTMLLNGVPVAVPYEWGSENRKCIMALVEQVGDVYSLRSHMLNSLNMYGVNVSYIDSDSYPDEWHYISVISKCGVPYKLPYELIDKNILDQQIKLRELKDSQEATHIEL